MRKSLSSGIRSVFLEIFFGISFCFVHFSLHAQTYGCHVQRGTQEVLYYTPYGAGSPSEWRTVSGAPPISSTGEQSGYRNDGTGSGCIKDIGGSCTVYQEYEISEGPPQLTGMRVYKTGIYASLAPINCSIDDYISLVLFVAAGMGIFILRKRAVKIST